MDSFSAGVSGQVVLGVMKWVVVRHSGHVRSACNQATNTSRGALQHEAAGCSSPAACSCAKVCCESGSQLGVGAGLLHACLRCSACVLTPGCVALGLKPAHRLCVHLPCRPPVADATQAEGVLAGHEAKPPLRHLRLTHDLCISWLVGWVDGWVGVAGRRQQQGEGVSKQADTFLFSCELQNSA